MAQELNFDFKQSYNQDTLYIQDYSVYEDRDSINSFLVEFWDWSSGIDNSGGSTVYSYSIDINDSDWSVFWDEILTGVYVVTNKLPITDGSYWFKVTLTDTSLNSFESPASAYGFYQETENEYTSQHLGYDWTNRYMESESEIYQIAKLSNWFEALELSIKPGSLIGNFNSILSNIRKYLGLSTL